MTGKTVYLKNRKVLEHSSSKTIVMAIFADKLLYPHEQIGRLNHKYIPADAKMDGL